jgi:hypothetical protein
VEAAVDPLPLSLRSLAAWMVSTRLLPSHLPLQVKFLRIAATEPDVCKAPFMIDSSKFEIIEAGLQNVSGAAVAGRSSLLLVPTPTSSVTTPFRSKERLL